MKRFLPIILLSSLSFFACTPPEETIDGDQIKLTRNEISLSGDPYFIEITVTSTQEWSVQDDCEWVAVTPESGKTVDVVTFDIERNLTEEQRVATFRFTAGDAETDFKITQAPFTIDAGVSVAELSSAPDNLSVNLIPSGAELATFKKWGVAYSTSDNMEEAEEVKAKGTPASGEVTVQISGLQPETTYYVWGWLEDNTGFRLWSTSFIEVMTEAMPISEKLSGAVIGTQYSVDYSTNSKSTTVNIKENVFDGNYDTFFASYDRSQTWVGLDLGKKHVITKVGWSPRVDSQDRVELALFEGANEADFSDALPIWIVKEPGQNRTMHYADVTCTRGFRYVRYVGPNNDRCNVSEIEFYGYAGEGDDTKLYQLTNLPTVVINTPGAQEITSKEYELSSNVYIISKDGTDLLATSETGVRGRGNASWGFEKKPYRLKFDSKQSPLGAPASAKKWTLIANYGDKTLMRNILAFEVSRRVGLSYTPFCHPVDVIVNGEYRGTYHLCDQVEAASGRVEAKDGYLIEIDAYAYQESVMFNSKKGIPVTIKHPDEDDITSTQWNFIEDYFNKMEAAVFSGNFTDPASGYRKYMDLDSFLKNFIVGEFAGNTDTFWSVYMYKDDEQGKLFTGPVWDYDLAFENDRRTYPINSLSDYIYVSKGSVASDSVRNMVTRIVKNDPQAKARLLEIWYDAKPQLEALVDLVDEKALMLDESQSLNFKRWNIMDLLVHENFKIHGSYEAEVKNVRDYISNRLVSLENLMKK